MDSSPHKNHQRRRWTDFFTVQKVGVLLLILSLASAIIGYITLYPDGFDFRTFAGDFYANISSELFSIAITVLIIDALSRRRDAIKEENAERMRLVRQLGSSLNEVAKRAAEELRADGWLTDGSLQEQDLRVANLEDAKLWKADFQGANLQWARLKRANLNGATLAGANLTQANLQTTRLAGADLRGANLFEAKLYRAILKGAYLQNANLTSAHLEGAKMIGANLYQTELTGAYFDETTVLPNGEAWSEATDMTQFTHTEHPNYGIASDMVTDNVDEGDE